jgi:hypothetical protein
MRRKSRQEDLSLEVSARGVLVAGGCYPADYFQTMRKILGRRRDAPAGRAFGDADLPAIRSELALAAYVRRREIRPLLEVLRRGEATPAVQRLVAELLDEGKPLPRPRHSKWRKRAIAVEVDQLRESGCKAGVANRRVAAAYSVSISTVEAAVREERAWLAERKAELPPGARLAVWL